jgi:hypothetical protein
MLYEVKIGKLSNVQKSNLKKGKSARIKKGSADVLFLTEKQVKGLDKNSKLGKAYTIKLSPEQISKVGAGIIGDLVGLVHPTAGKLASMVGLGMKKNGAGFIENLAMEAAKNIAKSGAKFAVDKAGEFAKGKIEGLGAKKRRAKRSATPSQLKALAKGRAIRDANRKGGALFPA